MSNVNEQIEEEESRVLTKTAEMTPGSDEYTDAIKSLDILAGVKLADEKFAADCEDKMMKNAIETEKHNDSIEIENRKLKAEKLRNITTLLAALIPAGVKIYEVATNRKSHKELLTQRKYETELQDKYFDAIMYFEEKGKVVSDAGRQWMSKILFKYDKK